MAPKVVVVGYCASGKTTLVDSLRERGIDASAVAQEHSIIDELWNHYSPDAVIFLDVSLDVVRQRRGNPDWPEWIYKLQTQRLESARNRADLVIATDDSDAETTLQTVLEHLGLSEPR